MWQPVANRVSSAPILKKADELAKMREAGRIVAAALEAMRKAVRPGITTLELDRIAEQAIRARGAVPTFKGYVVGDKVYRHSICASINDEVVHGIPSNRKLKEGDIISLDCGATYQNYVADSAFTMGVGKISPEAERLIRVTEEALYIGIDACRLGNRLGDIGFLIQLHAESNGYSVVREYVGHGVGTAMHEPPQVPNYGNRGRGAPLQKGLVLALEPMLNMGAAATRVMPDRWTVKTVDGSLSAHFEHTVAITDGDPLILTLP